MAMTAEEDKKAEEEKNKILNFLQKQADNFRCAVSGKVYARDQLIKEIEIGSESAKIIIQALSGASTDPSPTALGRRYRCLVCGTEILAVKSGTGRAMCCDQIMVLLEPRPMPSSD